MMHVSSQGFTDAPVRRIPIAPHGEVETFAGGSSDPDAPAIVFVHGMGHDTRAAWTALATRYAATHRLIAFDLPGFGASDATYDAYTLPFFTGALAAVMNAYAPHDVKLVGHSLGGLIAAAYAADNPERVRMLTLIAPAGFLRTPALALRVVGSGPVLALLRTIRPGPAFVRRTLARSVYDSAAIAENDRERLVARALDPASTRAFLGVYAGAIRDLMRMAELHVRLRAWTGPTLLVWGAADRFIPVRALATARTVYPQAAVLELQRCGHCPALEFPDAVATAMRDNGA